MKLIDKSALIAEIEKIQNEFSDSSDRNGNFDDLENQGAYKALDRLESFLDTLEVKKVDLEKEINNELDRTWYGEYLNTDKFKESAVYFFELGLKAKQS